MRLLESLGTRMTAAWTDLLHVEADSKMRGSEGVEATIALTGLHNNNGLGRGPGGVVMICDASGGVTYLAHEEEGRKLKVDGEIAYKSTIDNPSWFVDEYPGDKDRSGIVNAGLSKALAMGPAIHANHAVPPVIYLSSGSVADGWNTTVLFSDNGLALSTSSAAVMISIDPATNHGAKQAWLFMSGFASQSIVASRVDL